MALISVQDVHKHYQLGKAEAPALVGVSLEVERAERLCLMGPSGSGKSTLLNIIGCIDRASAGKVLVDDKDTGKLGDGELSRFRNKTMGFVFQTFNLIPVLSVFENVEYPLLLQNLGSAERKKRVMTLLEQVGLADYARRSPENLSGGQRQRVAIARALVGQPRLVIADEPTAALDHKTGTSIMELMVEMNQNAGSTLIFSTHDPSVAAYAKRIVKMSDGQIVNGQGAQP